MAALGIAAAQEALALHVCGGAAAEVGGRREFADWQMLAGEGLEEELLLRHVIEPARLEGERDIHHAPVKNDRVPPKVGVRRVAREQRVPVVDPGIVLAVRDPCAAVIEHAQRWVRQQPDELEPRPKHAIVSAAGGSLARRDEIEAFGLVVQLVEDMQARRANDRRKNGVAAAQTVARVWRHV